MRDIKDKLSKRDYRYIDSPAGALNFATGGIGFRKKMSKAGAQRIGDYELEQGNYWLDLPEGQKTSFDLKLAKYVMAKFLVKMAPHEANYYGIRGPEDWAKLNNPLVFHKVLTGFAMDNPLLAGLAAAAGGHVARLAKQGLGWVTNKIGGWLGLNTPEPLETHDMVTLPNPLSTHQNHLVHTNAGANPYIGYGQPHTFTVDTSDHYNVDAVCLETIAALICPERGAERMPVANGTATAMAHACVQIPFYTDSNGNGFMMLFP